MREGLAVAVPVRVMEKLAVGDEVGVSVAVALGEGVRL